MDTNNNNQGDDQNKDMSANDTVQTPSDESPVEMPSDTSQAPVNETPANAPGSMENTSEDSSQVNEPAESSVEPEAPASNDTEVESPSEKPSQPLEEQPSSDPVDDGGAATPSQLAESAAAEEEHDETSASSVSGSITQPLDASQAKSPAVENTATTPDNSSQTAVPGIPLTMPGDGASTPPPSDPPSSDAQPGTEHDGAVASDHKKGGMGLMLVAVAFCVTVAGALGYFLMFGNSANNTAQVQPDATVSQEKAAPLPSATPTPVEDTVDNVELGDPEAEMESLQTDLQQL